MNIPKIRPAKSLLTAVMAFGFALTLASTVWVQKAQAAAAQLYLSPSVGTLTQNNNVVISVRVNHNGDTSNTVQANLSYPTAKLQYLSTALGSAYDIVAENSGGNGTIRIGLGKIGSVTGDQLIANLTFKVLGNSGSGAITWDSGSAAVNGGTSVLAGTANASFGFQAPASTPPPTSGGGSTPTTSTPKPSTSTPTTTKPSPATPVSTQTAPTGDKTPPQISNIRSTNIGFNSATVEWDTDEASSSVIEYGPTDAYGATAQAPGATQKHAVALAPEMLVAGTAFHFRVTSVDASGNVATSGDQTLRIKGYTVQVKVVDSSGKAVKGAKVSLADVVETTNAEGIAEFTDMPAGQQTVTVDVKGAAITKSAVNIEPNVQDGKPLSQSFEVRVGEIKSTSWTIPALIGGIAVILLAAGGGFWFFNMRGRPPRFGGGVPSSHAGATPAGLTGMSGTNPIDRVAKPNLPSSGSVIDPNAESAKDDEPKVHIG